MRKARWETKVGLLMIAAAIALFVGWQLFLMTQPTSAQDRAGGADSVDDHRDVRQHQREALHRVTSSTT